MKNVWKILFLLIFLGSISSCISFLDYVITQTAFKAGLTEKILVVDGQEYSYLDNKEHYQAEMELSNVELDSTIPLVLIHGFAGEKWNWSFFSLHFSNFLLLVPDIPLLSVQSQELLPETLTLELFTQKLAQFLEAMGYEKYHVLGFSVGATLAALYSLEYPQYTESVVLISPMSGYFDNEFLREIKQKFYRKIAVLPRSKRDHSYSIKAVFYNTYRLPYFVYAYMEYQSVPRYERQLQIFKSILLHDSPFPLEGKMENLKVPTLLVWGKQDKVFPVSIVENLEKASPLIRSAIINKAGHAVHIEKEKEVVAAIKAFLPPFSN